MSRRDARTTVLARIRSALTVAPPGPVDVPRDYDRAPLADRGSADHFAENVADYGAQVLRIDGTEIAATIASLVPSGNVVAVPADLPPEWSQLVNAVVDAPGRAMTVTQLDQVAAVVTGCALGIAATGTIVLDAGTTQGRRALTLLPDHHICVVFTDQIVDTVPQAFAALNPSAPLTFISGASATSDIELNRIEGVHGPRVLDVLLVER